MFRYVWLVGFLAAAACKPPANERGPGPEYPSLLGQPAPSLAGALTWLNSSEATLEQLRGKPFVLHFFDYSCVNCIRTYPYLQEWERRYAKHGLRLIGVHAPQYDFSADPANVVESVKRYRLTHPIAVDSLHQIAGVYSNRFWPRTLVVDGAGQVRFDHTGEGAYTEAEQVIQGLLRQGDSPLSLPALFPPIHDFEQPGAVCYPVTSELYLGTLRGRLGNPETNGPTFQLPVERVEGSIYAQGDWTIHQEYVRHAVDKDHLEDALVLRYRATELNVVMKPESIYWMQVVVELDGRPVPQQFAGADIQYDEAGRSFVKVDVPRMYNLTHRQPYGVAEAVLRVRGKGLSVYSFSFGTCAIPKDTPTFKSTKE